MTYQVNCPACRQPLYFLTFRKCEEDFVEGICTRCKYKYALVQVEVYSCTSHVEVSPNSEYLPQKRSYQMRLIQADGTLKSLEFSSFGQSKKISGIPGDIILLLYIMRGKQLEDLVWLENSTTGKSHLLIKPGAKARSTGFATATLTLVGSTLLAGFLQIPTNHLFWATATTSSIGVGVYVSKRSSLKVRDRVELQQLASEQYLLAQKHELEQKITILSQELQANRKLVGRLQTLQQRMISTEQEQYTNRVEIVTRGIAVLEKQLELTRNLIDGYSQLVEIIEIEYETSQLAEQLPEDVSARILNQLDELKAVESVKEELSLLLNPQQLLEEF